MIIGLGIDLIDIRRIENSLTRFGERFSKKLFTETERKESERRKDPAASYAKRFVAKESCSKALGTGISHGILWRNIGVVNLTSGKPTIELTGNAKKRLDTMIQEDFEGFIHLTLTDNYPLAQALVIIESLEKK
ncbi:holo-ACP synthase [Candidatus Endowatersipora endosymbiont of Watersipora subatra]|uniref:holo-ACP synthase n=1 Tax=Candidatus Endowatersipora endosymbiont of Watersipora subatra TaxID=3077946 RepID=UPI00312C7115